jgi:hypothetical protein
MEIEYTKNLFSTRLPWRTAFLESMLKYHTAMHVWIPVIQIPGFSTIQIS